MASFDAPISGPWNLVVLAGGESHERDVSLKSGAAVSNALTSRGHKVTRWDPLNVDLSTACWDGVDAVFLALHGKFGEDGSVQALLEKAAVRYTGSDSSVSRLAFSKSASKERFFQCGVQTPAYVLVHESDDAARIEKQARKLGYPLVVKPDAQGSSFGVSIVHSPEDLPQSLARCFHFDTFGILEPAIAGTEWTVGLLDKRTLPLIQIETEREFYDFEAKYNDETTQYLFEFALPPVVVQEIEPAARRAAGALGVRGLSRVDLRLDRMHRPWVLEVNTVPGFTDHSLVPKAAERMGMSLGELCEEAISSCLRAAHSSSH